RRGERSSEIEEPEVRPAVELHGDAVAEVPRRGEGAVRWCESLVDAAANEVTRLTVEHERGCLSRVHAGGEEEDDDRERGRRRYPCEHMHLYGSGCREYGPARDRFPSYRHAVRK